GSAFLGKDRAGLGRGQPQAPGVTAMYRLLALALLVALGGCGAASVPVTSGPPASEVTRSVEQDGKFIALIGPRRQHAEPFLGVASTNFYALRSWVDTRTGETVHQLYVSDS